MQDEALTTHFIFGWKSGLHFIYCTEPSKDALLPEVLTVDLGTLFAGSTGYWQRETGAAGERNDVQIWRPVVLGDVCGQHRVCKEAS